MVPCWCLSLPFLFISHFLHVSNLISAFFFGVCLCHFFFISHFLYIHFSSYYSSTLQLCFPITIRKHWFSFFVCLKGRAFTFLDPAFNEHSEFHLQIGDMLVHFNQFVSLLKALCCYLLRFISCIFLYSSVLQTL